MMRNSNLSVQSLDSSNPFRTLNLKIVVVVVVVERWSEPLRRVSATLFMRSGEEASHCVCIIQ